MVRGIEKRDIFEDDNDRSAFVDRLSHLLVKTKTDCLAWSFLIHLNPIRAGLVQTMEKLDAFKWSGHAVIMGHGKLPGQASDEVLHMFDDNRRAAIRKYRDFVAEGIALGKRDELVGGGLKRYLKFSGSHDFEAYDERILGSGEFVEQLWHETEHLETPANSPPPLDEVIEQVANVFGIDAVGLLHGGKEQHLADARGAICYIAIRKFGYHGVEVSKSLGLSRSGVVLAARRGEAIYESMASLREIAE
jgi:hypothetical protein